MKDSSMAEELYLSLLKRCLTRYGFGESYEQYEPKKGSLKRAFYAFARRLLASQRLELVRPTSFDPQARAEGRDWPLEAETMIGLKRLDHLQSCVTDILLRRVPGDLIETGVWRGGASIFMSGAEGLRRDEPYGMGGGFVSGAAAA